MNECFCGCTTFTLNLKYKTAMCTLCKLMWETNDEGDIIATLLPEAHARCEREPEPEVSLMDMFIDEIALEDNNAM